VNIVGELQQRSDYSLCTLFYKNYCEEAIEGKATLAAEPRRAESLPCERRIEKIGKEKNV